MSATFPRAVHALAARYQQNPAVVAGSDAGKAHEDIEHIGHIVAGHERYGALVNVLLMAPDERALVFVRTRIGASELAARLATDGFRAACLSGELSQDERTRTLDAFRSGALTVLVCTDVAARGIDVPDVTRVIHGDLPDNGEVLTHRSGRTGRAGNKGQSIMLVSDRERGFAEMLLQRANVRARLAPAPTPADIQAAAEARLLEQLTGDSAADVDVDAAGEGHAELAAQLIETLGAQAAVEALLARSGYEGPCAAHKLTPPRAPKPQYAQRSYPPRQAAPQGRGPKRAFQRAR